MLRWIGVAIATRPAGSDREMVSRLPIHLHPLAGRPLLYHSLQGLAEHDPAPESILLVGDADVQTDWLHEISVPVTLLAPDEVDGATLSTGDDIVFVAVDATVPLVGSAVDRMLAAAESGTLCRGRGGEIVAARLGRTGAERVMTSAHGLAALDGEEGGRDVISDHSFAVRNRADLARASIACRDRVVRSLMRNGVSFFLPESVLIDLDVTIGPDTVVYPNVVLEGTTSIGRETVIGPGCRIINSRIGSGVELKGWNYISHTSVRNRAILEPYVRRGYD